MEFEPVIFNYLNIDISFLTKDPFTFEIFHKFLVFLLNFTSYAYLSLKVFKVLCYSYMTFEWLPMINPYVWPYSFFRSMTRWYFRFWEEFLPSIPLNDTNFEVSTIIGLEALNSAVFFCVRFTQFLVKFLENLDSLERTLQ